MRRVFRKLIGINPIGSEIPPIKGDYLERKGIAKYETKVDNRIFEHWRRESDKALLGSESFVMQRALKSKV